MAMIDVYGISESGKKVKVGQVNESQVLNPVGGKIFYIDNTADGTYTFYDSNGSTVSAPSLGDNYTGYYYTVDGASKDKYYIYSENARFGYGRTGTQADPYLCWSYLDEANQSWIDNTSYTSGGAGDYTYLGQYGRVGELFNFEFNDYVQTPIQYQNQFIYEGKRITNTLMTSFQRNVTINGVTTNTQAYIQGPQIFRRDISEKYAETIWYVLDKFNKNQHSLYPNNTGCNDWYIPCFQEFQSIQMYFNIIGGGTTEGTALAREFFMHGEENTYTFTCTPIPESVSGTASVRFRCYKNVNAATSVTRTLNSSTINLGQLVLFRSF